MRKGAAVFRRLVVAPAVCLPRRSDPRVPGGTAAPRRAVGHGTTVIAGYGRAAHVSAGEGGGGVGRASVVIPAHNTERHVGECIESALNQTYPDIEVVAVDDGSTDGTAEVLAGYSDRIRVVEHGVGRGVSAARNAGVEASSGRWIKFLDSDDVLEPDAVEELAKAVAALPAPVRAVPFGDALHIGEAGEEIGRDDPYPYNSLGTVEQGAILLEDMYASPPRQLIARPVFDEVGRFDERYRTAEDAEFNLRLTVMHGYRLHHVPRIVYRYRQGRAGHLSGDQRGYARAHRGAARAALGSLDRRRRGEYERAAARYRRAKWFRLGMWYYANPDLAALRTGGAGDGSPVPARAMLRSPLARAALRSLRSRSTRALAGWWWARRNAGHEDVERLRGRQLGMAVPR